MRELLGFFERYYGEIYANEVLGVMAEYLGGYSEEFYRAAAKVLVKRFSRTYNKAPGPAEIEKHKEEILAVIPRPYALPEPEEAIATREEVEGFLKEMRERMGRGTGPMAETLANVFETMGST